MSNNNNQNVDDIYFMAYNIIVSSIKDNNISKALMQIKFYLGAKAAILYSQDEQGHFHFYEKADDLNYDYEKLGSILTQYQDVLTTNPIMNISTTPINLPNRKFHLVVIHNPTNRVKMQKKLLQFFGESLSIILDKVEYIKELKKASEEDALTNVGNRRAYYKKLNEIDENNSAITITMLDVFQLKFVNDNYGHAVGDLYLKMCVEIVKKYFPEAQDYSNLEANNYIYRIGGDEFAIISNLTEDIVQERLQQAANEIEYANYDFFANIPTGLNFGIAARTGFETSEELCLLADNNLSKDKLTMYQRRKLNRRK